MTDKNDKNDNGVPDWLEDAYSRYIILEIVKSILYFIGLIIVGYVLNDLKGLFGG